MWTIRSTVLSPGTIRFQIEKEGSLLSVAEVMEVWQHNPAFRQFYNQLLADAPFPAFFWELPAMTRSRIHQGFEFVLVNSPTLAKVKAEQQVFEDYFVQEKAVVVFPNLGGDATLVVPAPVDPSIPYPHLAQFVRTAPADQIDQFWQAVGNTYAAKLSDRPLWLSTSGLGVYWVHVRLDNWPKYYTFGAYRK